MPVLAFDGPRIEEDEARGRTLQEIDRLEILGP